jgi:hypothetical protein
MDKKKAMHLYDCNAKTVVRPVKEFVLYCFQNVFLQFSPIVFHVEVQPLEHILDKGGTLSAHSEFPSISHTLT